MPDTDKGRRLLVGVLAAVVVTAVVVFLLTRPSDGYLLRKGDLEAAKHHMQLRRELAKLDAALAAQPPGDDAPARVDLEVRLATVQLQLGMSRFRRIADEDLRHGIEAGEHGRFIEERATERPRGIYDGQDDRMDLADVLAEIEKQRLPTGDGQRRVFLEKAIERSKSVGAWVRVASLGKGQRTVPLRTITLGKAKDLCRGQRFASQPLAAIGTGFLAGGKSRGDIVVTAAHVFDGVQLSSIRFVLDFVVPTAGANPMVCRHVYTPVQWMASDEGKGRHDWAIVKLDRPVVGGVALEFAEDTAEDTLVPNSPIYLWGHSAGTPKKFVEGTVHGNNSRKPWLVAKLDAFGGDSGAPVFNHEHKVVGVLYGGSTDWVYSGGCFKAAPAWIEDDGEHVTRIEEFRHDVDDLR